MIAAGKWELLLLNQNKMELFYFRWTRLLVALVSTPLVAGKSSHMMLNDSWPCLDMK